MRRVDAELGHETGVWRAHEPKGLRAGPGPALQLVGGYQKQERDDEAPSYVESNLALLGREVQGGWTITRSASSEAGGGALGSSGLAAEI